MSALDPTWTPKVCKIMAFMAIIWGLGLLFYILLGFRYALNLGLRDFEGWGSGVCPPNYLEMGIRKVPYVGIWAL